ncbi:Uncharacterised protein [Klebsiella pneumoniae]|nr:Uncharacterised protein [Klebsiella pneumoniae]
MHVLLHRIHQLAAGMAVHRAQLTVEAFKLHLTGQIRTVFIQQQTHRGWRQEAVKLKLFRRLRFHNVDQLHQQRAHR